MLDEKTMYSAGKAIGNFLKTFISDNSSTLDNNSVIDFLPMIKEWVEGDYKVNDIVKYNGLPYRCVIAHSSVNNPTYNPKDAFSLWANYHAKDAQHVLPYKQPTGAHDAYMKGEYICWNHSDGHVREYVAKMDNLVYDPETYPQGWEEIVD